MADVERSCCGANNNIGVVPHGLSGPTSPITDGEVLIESEFLELNSQLHYSKTVHILLTDEFVLSKKREIGGIRKPMSCSTSPGKQLRNFFAPT